MRSRVWVLAFCSRCREAAVPVSSPISSGMLPLSARAQHVRFLPPISLRHSVASTSKLSREKGKASEIGTGTGTPGSQMTTDCLKVPTAGSNHHTGGGAHDVPISMVSAKPPQTNDDHLDLAFEPPSSCRYRLTFFAA